MPYLSQDFFIEHTTMDSTPHSRPWDSLEHCKCTTSTTNMWAGRDSNLVLQSFEPQPDRMSHGGRLLPLQQRRRGSTGNTTYDVLRNKQSIAEIIPSCRWWRIWDDSEINRSYIGWRWRFNERRQLPIRESNSDVSTMSRCRLGLSVAML